MPLFSPELLKRFHRLSLVAGRTGGSPLLAASRRRLPGGGTEVTGRRDYSPGDDFRAIDWTLCAKRDELYVKLFEGQADRDVYLLVDCSPSMGLGKPAKLQRARQVAAALGYVSLLRLDRLNVAAFADGLVAALPPLRHESRVVRLFRFLEELSPRGAKTDFLRAVQALVRRGRRAGPVVVISDLYDIEGWRPGFDLLRFHGYDPRLVQIIDPADADTSLLGDVELFDVESQSGIRATITERTVRRYRQLLAGFHETVRDYCRRKGVVFIPLACDTPEDEVYRRVLGCHAEALGRMDLQVRPNKPTTDPEVHPLVQEAAS
jgi:uncharacterized protein (DUF58 family)